MPRSSSLLHSTDLELKLWSDLRRFVPGIGTDVVFCGNFMHCKQTAGHIGVVSWIVSHFRNGAFAKVEVPRQAGIARELGLSCPELIIALRVAVGAREPFLIVLA